jgi:hypothetical protein
VNERIAHLSLTAIRLAASVFWTEPALAEHWLYRFGTVPCGPTAERDFGAGDDPLAMFSLSPGSRTRRMLEVTYEATSLEGWYSFARRPAAREKMVAACKLYVSPRPEALVDSFPRIADAFAQSEVRSFKVGRGIGGLLRPDKIIAYFEDHAHMQDAAGVLGRSLRGCPAQGVPFTAEVSGNGLLSCGVDPPSGDVAQSWRSWITKRLADSLTAQRGMGRIDLVTAALADIRLAGIDPDLWLPTPGFFRSESRCDRHQS